VTSGASVTFLLENAPWGNALAGNALAGMAVGLDGAANQWAKSTGAADGVHRPTGCSAAAQLHLRPVQFKVRIIGHGCAP